MIFECPHCKKQILENNVKQFKNTGDIVIKSRLVFLNEDGNVLCRCQQCKQVISLPLTFNKEEDSIQRKEVVDL